MVYRRGLGLNYQRFSQIATKESRAAIRPEAGLKYPSQGEATIKRYGDAAKKGSASEGK